MEATVSHITQDPKLGKHSTGRNSTSSPTPSESSSAGKRTAFESISPEARERICDEWGGQKVYIPKTAGPDTSLVKLIGQTDAEKLVAALGGLNVNIPTTGAEASRARRALVIEARRNGMFIAQIATRYKLTERQVHKILSEDDR